LRAPGVGAGLLVNRVAGLMLLSNRVGSWTRDTEAVTRACGVPGAREVALVGVQTARVRPFSSGLCSLHRPPCPMCW
jgi:hypothetical protein